MTDMIIPPAPTAIEVRVDTLVIAPEIAFNDWRRYGENLLKTEGAVQWFLGDWWVFGQDAFGMDYHPALEELSRSNITLLEYARVARAFPPRREKAVAYRISEVAWTHHRDLASLKDEQERMAWLEDCLGHGWSSRELKGELESHYSRDRALPAAISVRLVEDYFRIAKTAAERRGMDPKDWVLEAIREKAHRESPELEVA